MPSNPASIDNSLLAQPQSASNPQPQPLTVSQLSALIRLAIAQSLPERLHVVGQISNFSRRTHWFFSLKDESAAISCVCFASAARRVNFPISDGLEVIATGKLDYYDAQGRLQLYVDQLQPVGQGALELQFRALCDQLRQLGYFDPSRKKPLPLLPRRVAVVTSRAAAALQDVINTTRRRWPGCQLLLYDVPVQGPAAAPQIAHAIQALSQDGHRLGIDAVILTRGGGSIEDLWAFNERIVADALFNCSLPTVAAIGHETDVTIAELVADVRCATPTQASMTLIPDHRALDRQIFQLAHRLTLQLKNHHQNAAHHLRSILLHPLFRRPRHLVEQASRRLDAFSSQLGKSLPQTLVRNRTRLESLLRQLQAINPQNVLQRGYSYTLSPDGQVLRSIKQAHPDDLLTTVLSDGRVLSRVEPSSRLQPRSRKPIPKSAPPSSPQQPNLFDTTTPQPPTAPDPENPRSQ